MICCGSSFINRIDLSSVFRAFLFNYALSTENFIRRPLHKNKFMRNRIKSVVTNVYSGNGSVITFKNLKANLGYKSKEAMAIDLDYKFSHKIR